MTQISDEEIEALLDKDFWSLDNSDIEKLLAIITQLRALKKEPSK